MLWLKQCSRGLLSGLLHAGVSWHLDQLLLQLLLVHLLVQPHCRIQACCRRGSPTACTCCAFSPEGPHACQDTDYLSAGSHLRHIDDLMHQGMADLLDYRPSLWCMPAHLPSPLWPLWAALSRFSCQHLPIPPPPSSRL